MRFTSTTALLLGLSVAVSAAPLLSHEVETPTTTTTTASIDARSSHHHTSEPQPTSGIDIDDVPDSYYYRHDDDGEDSLEERALNLDKTWGSSLKWYPTKEPTWQKGQWHTQHEHLFNKRPGFRRSDESPEEDATTPTTTTTTDEDSSLDKRDAGLRNAWSRSMKWYKNCPERPGWHAHKSKPISKRGSWDKIKPYIPEPGPPAWRFHCRCMDAKKKGIGRRDLNATELTDELLDNCACYAADPESDLESNENEDSEVVNSLAPYQPSFDGNCYGRACELRHNDEDFTTEPSSTLLSSEALTTTTCSSWPEVPDSLSPLSVPKSTPADYLGRAGDRAYLDIWKNMSKRSDFESESDSNVDAHTNNVESLEKRGCPTCQPCHKPGLWNAFWCPMACDHKREGAAAESDDVADEKKTETSAEISTRDYRGADIYLDVSSIKPPVDLIQGNGEKVYVTFHGVRTHIFTWRRSIGLKCLMYVMGDFIYTDPQVEPSCWLRDWEPGFNGEKYVYRRDVDMNNPLPTDASMSEEGEEISLESSTADPKSKRDMATTPLVEPDYWNDPKYAPTMRELLRVPYFPCLHVEGCNFRLPLQHRHNGPRAGTSDLPRKPVQEASRNFLSPEQFEELYANPSSQESASELNTRTPTLIDLFKQADSEHVSQEDFDDFDEMPGEDPAVPDHGLGGFKREADEAPSWNEMKVVLSKTLKDEEVLKGWESSVEDCHWDAQTPSCYQTALLQFTTSAYQRTMASMGYVPEQANRYAEAYSFNMDAMKAQAGAMAAGCGADMETTPSCMKGLPAVFAEQLLD